MDLGVIFGRADRRFGRGFWHLAVVMLVIGVVAPALADAAKKNRHLPDASFAVASFEETEGRIGIAVKVSNAEAVSVQYAGVRREAVKINPTIFWWNAAFNGAAQDCYRVIVRARNDHGTIERRVGAGLLGTNGCADCSDLEAKVGKFNHRVKRARAAVRDADSKRERRLARRKLARAKNRLQNAQARLEACLT